MIDLKAQVNATDYLSYLKKNCITSRSSYKGIVSVRSHKNVKRFFVRRFINDSKRNVYSFTGNHDYDQYLYIDAKDRLLRQFPKKETGFQLRYNRADWIWPHFELPWFFPEYFWKTCIVGSGREFKGQKDTLQLRCNMEYPLLYVDWNIEKLECPIYARVYSREGRLRFTINYDYKKSAESNVLSKIQVVSVANQWIAEMLWTEYKKK